MPSLAGGGGINDHDVRGELRKGFGRERITSSTQTLCPLHCWGREGWGELMCPWHSKMPQRAEEQGQQCPLQCPKATRVRRKRTGAHERPQSWAQWDPPGAPRITEGEEGSCHTATRTTNRGRLCPVSYESWGSQGNRAAYTLRCRDLARLTCPRRPPHCRAPLAFLVACGEATAGHMLVWVEDHRHDVPGGGEGWRGHPAAEPPQQVARVPRGAVVDLQEVEATRVVVLQVKGVEGEQHGGALGHHDQPAALRVVRVEPGEVGAGEVSGRCWEHTPTFDTCGEREEWLRVSAGVLDHGPASKQGLWNGMREQEAMALNQLIYSCICWFIYLFFKYYQTFFYAFNKYCLSVGHCSRCWNYSRNK